MPWKSSSWAHSRSASLAKRGGSLPRKQAYTGSCASSTTCNLPAASDAAPARAAFTLKTKEHRAGLLRSRPTGVPSSPKGLQHPGEPFPLAPYSVQTRLYAARPRGRKGAKKRKSRSQRLFAFPLQFKRKRRTPSTAPREWPRLRTVAPGGTSAPRRAAFRGSLLGAAATVRRGRRPGQGARQAKRCTLRGFAARSGHAALVGPGQHGHEEGGDR